MVKAAVPKAAAMMVDFFERFDHIHGEFSVFCLIAPSGGNAGRTPCAPSLNSRGLAQSYSRRLIGFVLRLRTIP
jgi:hypothetical protein